MNEEKMYEEVYRFLRRRENRAATIERIVEVTGVTETLLHKWVRKGRLQPALFPNLGYPCDNCGKLTTKENYAKAVQQTLKMTLKHLRRRRNSEKQSKKMTRQHTMSDRNQNKTKSPVVFVLTGFFIRSIDPKRSRIYAEIKNRSVTA